MLPFASLSVRVMIHIVAQCHEEGLEHYLRSYVKVKPMRSLNKTGFYLNADHLSVNVSDPVCIQD